MIKIPVVRQYEGGDSLRFAYVAISLLTGILIGLWLPNRVLPNQIDGTKLVSAVGLSQGKIAVNPQVTDTKVSPGVPLPQGDVPGAESAVAIATKERSIRDVTQDIRDKEIIQERLAGEIALLRQSGISIVSEFKAECNDWLLPCGQDFNTRLNENNTIYSIRENELREIEVQLQELRSEL